MDDERVLSMVEIRAARGEKVLHNFAGFLAHVRHDQIVELWMVDANLPTATSSGPDRC